MFSEPFQHKQSRSELQNVNGPIMQPAHVVTSLNILEGAIAISKQHINGAIVPYQLRENPFSCSALLEYFLTNKIAFEGNTNELRQFCGSLKQEESLNRASAHKAIHLLQEDLLCLGNALTITGKGEPGFCVTASPYRGESWHTDIGLSVGFITYYGPGTEFVDSTDAIPNRGRYAVRSAARSFSANTNDVLFIRGDIQGQHTSEGLVHRAPPGANRKDRIVAYAYVATDPKKIFSSLEIQ